jgi:putative ABC transport system permease protein
VVFSSADAIKSRALRAQAARVGWRAASSVIFLQFALSTVSALMVLGIYLQVSLLRHVDSGLDTGELVVSDARFSGPANAAGFEALKQELASLPEVEAISIQNVNPPSTGGYSTWISAVAGEPGTPMSSITVAPEFLATWNVPLVAGRNFSREFPSELVVANAEPGRNFGILMTRSATRRLGYASPEDVLGEQFRYGLDRDGRTYTVIGVVEDFRFSPIVSDTRTVAVLLGSVEPMRSFALRLRKGAGQEAVDAIRTVWNRHIPGVPFNLRFMDDVINAEINAKTQSLALAASLATLVFFCTAIIGIYAQAAFVCDRNAKSIAIRKVFGSSRSSILRLLLAQFSAPVVASFALALPTALYFIREFYSSFQQTPGFPVWLYVACLGGVVAIALVTVFAHCQRAAARHPIHTLRYE